MERSTATYIIELLNREISQRKSRMMDCIDNGFDAFLKDRIADYREVLYVREDFCEWVDGQNLEEGSAE